MTPFTRIESRAVLLAVDNIDTDQIIPARFLTTISRAGLGDNLFHDWRYDADGRPIPGFALNQPGARGAQILVGGRNFGGGSSREHAAWALREFGFRAVIALSFADIFRQNALKNGIVPIVVPDAVHAGLVRLLAADPAALVRVDLVDTSVTLPGGATVPFAIDAFARECLLNGVDDLGYVVAREHEIARYEREHPARFDTRRG
jgi:3-isopropylmalate/(R)-2-methylmalate dehydratase small subunit